MLKQAETLPSSPEDLLRFCDGELHRLRAKREGTRQQRMMVLAVSLLVLIGGAVMAFFLLFTRLQELRPAHDGGASAPAETVQ